jgi:hypothetical protein
MTKKHNIMLSNRLNKKQNQEKYIDKLKIKRFFALLKKFSSINHRHDRKTNTFMVLF